MQWSGYDGDAEALAAKIRAAAGVKPPDAKPDVTPTPPGPRRPILRPRPQPAPAPASPGVFAGLKDTLVNFLWLGKHTATNAVYLQWLLLALVAAGIYRLVTHRKEKR